MRQPPLSLFQRFRQRIWLWLRPPRQLKTTTLGKLVIVFAIVIGVAATNTGNNLLYLVLGGLFGIIAASGVLSERILKGLLVQVMPPAVAIAGRDSAVGITLTAAARVDSFLLDIELLDGERGVLGKSHFRELLRGTRRSATARVKPGARGAYRISKVRIATRFPFQMYEKARLFDLPSLIWVAPAPEPVHRDVLRALDGAAQTRMLRNRDGEVYRGLRERESSDPLSRIHWKQTAATGKHVVKIFTTEAAPQIEIRLGQGGSEALFETGLSQAAGIVDVARRRERGVKLIAGTREAIMQSDGSGWEQVQLLLAKLVRADLPVSVDVFDTRLVA